MNSATCPGLIALHVSGEQDVYQARQVAREVARLVGLDGPGQISLATAVSELTRELVVSRVSVSITFSLTADPAPALVIGADWTGPLTYDSLRQAEGIAAAERLTDSCRVDPAPAPRRVQLVKRLPPDLTASLDDLAELVRDTVSRAGPVTSLEALRSQNRDLLAALETVEAQQQDLRRANRELEETNRGVVALYGELDAAVSKLRDTSHILQQAMLSEPPDVAGVEICVRYRPAGARDGDEAGGDWYDVFPLPGGDLAVVVGDVVGHGTEAAATMGQLRAMLRGLAYHNDEQPDRTLQSLDRVVRRMGLTSFTTVVYARLHLGDRGDPSSGVAVSWSNAGHPGFVVAHPESTVALVETPHDPPLGVADGLPRTLSCRVLATGSTLLLFSDGLFERRGENLDDCMARFLSDAAPSSEAPLPELCEVLVRNAPGDDDLVLVALRLDPR